MNPGQIWTPEHGRWCLLPRPGVSLGHMARAPRGVGYTYQPDRSRRRQAERIAAGLLVVAGTFVALALALVLYGLPAVVGWLEAGL